MNRSFSSVEMDPRPRGLPENPAQGRRIVAAAAANIPLPPVPPLRDADVSSNASLLAASGPPSSSQVIQLAKEAMKVALEENETQSQAAEATGVSNELRPGLTIDLSRKNIVKLPDEVVDIIKRELERLALSHNSLQSFPTRFSECTSLRYLNVRNNKIKEFPLPLCDLKSLEILDLGRNSIKVLPPDIVKLSSLKVLAVQKNLITELPLCLGDMASLQVLKHEGNPITFPPAEVFQVQASSPPNEGFLKDSEVTEVTVTAHLKKFLKQKQLAALVTMNSRSDTETTGDESSEGTETPRQPLKRAMSGRFPIKVPSSNPDAMDSLRSPSMSRPPPIPTRSHYRGLSQQTPAKRRPGVMPLTIGNPNERLRSNSETLVPTNPRTERPESRLRRMGVLGKKGSDLSTLDETQANNRFSVHYRGLSHGSAMQGNGGNLANSPMSSPAQEPFLQRPVYVRRLSVLPERRRESRVFDPVVEAAKGILYSIFQIHPAIQGFIHLASDDADRRSSLEFVLYNTNAHVEELELEITNHDRMAEQDGYDQHENENVQRACVTLVNAYAHVCSLLVSHVDLFIDNGDPRYIRSLLTQLYNSIMELRVTCNQVTSPPTDGGYRRTLTRTNGTNGVNDTIHQRSRGASITPTTERVGLRPRNGTISHNPSNLRVATDVGMSGLPYIQGTGRTATITSAIPLTATPRSGESFVSAKSSARNLLSSSEFSEQDILFEKIFLSLQRSTDLVARTIPNINAQFASALRNATAQRSPESNLKWWRALVSECNMLMSHCADLRSRLSSIRVKEPGIRTQTSFWSPCQKLFDSWTKLITLSKNATSSIPLPLDIRSRLKPIQKSLKETGNLIHNSPWAEFVHHPGGGQGRSRSNTVMSHTLYDVQSPNSSFPLPMTPQSAALGPAVQATVPSTPSSANFANAFSGNVFERADALMASLGGGTAGHSRTGTMSDAGMGREREREREVVSPQPGAAGMPMPLRLGERKAAF